MQEYIFRCGGKELAKVLYYYGLIYDTATIERKIPCPFHNDVNPSMLVDLHTGKFFCFGCQETGDAFYFVRRMHPKLDDLQAGLRYFRILKSKKVCKINVVHQPRVKKANEQAYAEAWDYYYGLSKVDWVESEQEEVVKARAYMLQRGFTKEVLNLCQAKVTYNYSYPIIFPMLDNAEFKGWVCRTDKKQVEQKRKYLYNEGFMRRDTLVGTYGRKDYVFVVEGYMDRLRMLQNLQALGITEDVVAILGWKASSEHIAKLKRAGIKYIISALDNDECGRKGTAFLKTKFTVVRFSYLKRVKDPGEMSQQQFKKMYEKTMKKLAQERQKR